MLVMLAEMGVNLGQHTSVLMAHQFRDYQLVVAFDQLAGGKAVTPGVSEMLDAGMLLQAAETAIHGVGGPRPSIGVQEHIALGTVAHPSPDDVGGEVIQPDDP